MIKLKFENCLFKIIQPIGKDTILHAKKDQDELRAEEKVDPPRI